jgi:hypothetical protein
LEVSVNLLSSVSQVPFLDRLYRFTFSRIHGQRFSKRWPYPPLLL